jgi:hypothetical protein
MVTPEVAPSFRGRGREKNVEFTRVSRFVRPDLIAPTRKKVCDGLWAPHKIPYVLGPATSKERV